MTKKGKQLSVFSDKDVRRDYLKSHQWVEQHLKIKVHITGYATAYESFEGKKPNREPRPNDSRPQGSLYSQQKHAIADAIEWIRQNSKYKPRIWVNTTPGFIDPPAEGRLISQFCKNLKNNYELNEYVWVRELTKRGYPHYHFVGDIPEFDPVKLSRYWSSLFGVDAKNCIRLGTRPSADGKRNYWIKNSRMAWYMSKYIGKDVSGESDATAGNGPGHQVRKPYRSFGISQLARSESAPLLYNSFISRDFSNRIERRFVLDDEQLSDLIDKYGDTGQLPAETVVNPSSFDWRWTGHGQTYSGFRQEKGKKYQRKR